MTKQRDQLTGSGTNWTVPGRIELRSSDTARQKHTPERKFSGATTEAKNVCVVLVQNFFTKTPAAACGVCDVVAVV